MFYIFTYMFILCIILHIYTVLWYIYAMYSIHYSRFDHFIHTICEQIECFVGDCCQLSRHIICCNFQNWVLPNNCTLLNLLIRKCQMCQTKKLWLYLNNFMFYFTCLPHLFLFTVHKEICRRGSCWKDVQ